MDGEGQPDSVHAEALNLRHDGRNGLVLQTLGDHDIGCSRPVDAGVGEVGTRGIADPAARGYERAVGPCGASVEFISDSWGGESEANEASENSDEPHVGMSWRSIVKGTAAAMSGTS